MKRKQELHCHNCNRYIQFEIDLSLNGNHVLNCPNCNHEHCRVVKDGEITAERWDQRNQTFNITGGTTSFSSIYTGASDSSGASAFLSESWLNISTTCGTSSY